MRLSRTRYCQAAMTLLVGSIVIFDTPPVLADPCVASLPTDEPARQATEYGAEELYRLARQRESTAANDHELGAAIEQYRRALGLGHTKAR